MLQRRDVLSVILLLSFSAIYTTSSSSSSSSSSSAGSIGNTLPRSHSIPRSHNRHSSPIDTHNSRRKSFLSSDQALINSPPWNPSSQIDPRGFLRDLYYRVPGEWEIADMVMQQQQTVREREVTEKRTVRFRLCGGDGSQSGSLVEPDYSYNNYHQLCTVPVQIRQVPGDGNCLFHSISLCLRHAVNGTHWDMSDPCHLDDLYSHSCFLRQQAMQCLRQKHKRLVLQGRETLKAQELVQAAAQQYSLTPEEYCEAMEQESVWGGGPEIVALSNYLQRPIHVYELAVSENDADQQASNQKPTTTTTTTTTPPSLSSSPSSSPAFVLRRMACFGSPKFDRQGRPPLHILSADSRFPDLQPGQQLAAGNHFLAVFPQDSIALLQRRQKQFRKRKGLRGGAGEVGDIDDDDTNVLLMGTDANLEFDDFNTDTNVFGFGHLDSDNDFDVLNKGKRAEYGDKQTIENKSGGFLQWWKSLTEHH